MKKYRILLLICWCALSAVAQDSLCVKLDSLVRLPMFETSQLGLMVYDLRADTVLYEHHARQLMRPASTMKLVTAITALDRLGGDYQYRTRLCYTGDIQDGKLNGNIYCVGGFDPMVTADDIRSLVESMHLQGLDTLEGNVLADCSMKDTLAYGEGWCWDDDNPRLTPLSVGRKDIFVNQLLLAMQRDSIVLRNVGVGRATCPSGARLLGEIHRPLTDVLWRMMKNSDNFFAESMLYQIAASVGRRPARAADARQAIKQLVGRIGLGDNPYRFADGSGLSLYNYVSAELEVMLLRYAWRNRRIYDCLEPSLPVAGVDGTLEKRMKGEFTLGNVRAKTGTLTGISSLAGYLYAFDGRPLAFCIINQGVMRNKDGKDFQDRVCEVLCEP